MIKAKLFYRIYKAKNGKPIYFLGTAFPITKSGGFMTCRHVVDVKLSDGELIAIFDQEAQKLVPVKEIHFPDDTNLDIAYIPNALAENKGTYLPIIEPETLRVGEHVSTFGFFNETEDHIKTQEAYFAGNIVNFSKAPNSEHAAITLPFAIIEGMSGAPIIDYHYGNKLAGMVIGSKSARIVASESIEYEDDKLQYKETINRIVEFGVGYHATTIIQALKDLGIEDMLITNTDVDIPGLKS